MFRIQDNHDITRAKAPTSSDVITALGLIKLFLSYVWSSTKLVSPRASLIGISARAYPVSPPSHLTFWLLFEKFSCTYVLFTIYTFSLIFVIHTRRSAYVSAVAGTHAPGRGDGFEGLRRWLGDIITAVSLCRRGSKGQKTMPSCGQVDDTHASDWRIITCSTATSNPCLLYTSPSPRD